jgi:ankyrin repeat protein
MGFSGGDVSGDSTNQPKKSGGGGMGPVQSTMSDTIGESKDERQNFDGGEALFKAASEGDLDMIKTILGEGSSVTSKATLNSKDENGQTALHWASDRGQVEAVELLLSYAGILVSEGDQDGMTPLHYAVACEHEEVVKLLVQAGCKILNNC